MKIEERRVYVICNYIESCINGSSPDIYVYGNIPGNVIRGAQEAYANFSNDETVVCVVDTTIFRGGQRGMLFTDQNLYYRGILESSMCWNYCDPTLQFSDELPNDVYFNRRNLQKLMAYLFELEWAKYAGIGIYDTGIYVLHQINELFSVSIGALGEDIDLQTYGVTAWKVVKEAFQFLLSPENWLKGLERVFEIKDSESIKCMIISFDNFLEEIDLETWFLFFLTTDSLINVVLEEHQIDREQALLSDIFEQLIDKMEDAVNDYYDGVSLIDIVCNLKQSIDSFVAEVEYDMETVKFIFDE